MTDGAQAYCVVLTTCGSREDAEKLAGGLVKNRLAACVQLLPITSVYEWKEKIEQDEEVLLLIKTRDDRYGEVERFITENHAYETPEIVSVPVNNGLDRYLGWIDGVTGGC